MATMWDVPVEQERTKQKVAEQPANFAEILGGLFGKTGEGMTQITGAGMQAGAAAFDPFAENTARIAETYGKGQTQMGSDYMDAMQGFAGTEGGMYGDYSRGLTGLANTMSAEEINRMNAQAMIGAANQAAVGNVGSAGIGAAGSLGNQYLAGNAGMHQNYMNMIGNVGAQNQMSTSDLGQARMQALGNTGTNIANIGQEDIRRRAELLAGLGTNFTDLGREIATGRLTALSGLGAAGSNLGQALAGGYADAGAGFAPYMINKSDFENRNIQNQEDSSSVVDVSGILGGLGMGGTTGGGGGGSSFTMSGPSGPIAGGSFTPSTTSTVTPGVVGGGGEITSGGTKTSTKRESDTSQLGSQQSPDAGMYITAGNTFRGLDNTGRAGFGYLDALRGDVNDPNIGSRSYEALYNLLGEANDRTAANEAYANMGEIVRGINDPRELNTLSANFQDVMRRGAEGYERGLSDARDAYSRGYGGIREQAGMAYDNLAGSLDRGYNELAAGGTDFNPILRGLTEGYTTARDRIPGYAEGAGRAYQSGSGKLDSMYRSATGQLGRGFGRTMEGIDDKYSTGMEALGQGATEGSEQIRDLFDDTLGKNRMFMTGAEQEEAKADARDTRDRRAKERRDRLARENYEKRMKEIDLDILRNQQNRQHDMMRQTFGVPDYGGGMTQQLPYYDRGRFRDVEHKRQYTQAQLEQSRRFLEEQARIRGYI